MAHPDELADEISEARAKLVAFVTACSDEQWVASPLGEDDPRPVCLIVDHIADAYEYIGSWIEALAAGEEVSVNSRVVDDLNARHANVTTALSREAVSSHLDRSGDVIIGLVRRLEVGQLALGEGRVERLAQIASRHADDHRSDLEVALASRHPR